MADNDRHSGMREKIGVGVLLLLFIGFIVLIVNIFTGVGEFLWGFAPASDKYSFEDFIIWMAGMGLVLYVLNKLEKISWEVTANKNRLERIIEKINGK